MPGWIRLGWSLALKMHGILEGERECGKRRSGSQLWGSPQSAEQVQEGADCARAHEQAALWGRGRGLVGNVNSHAVPIPDLRNPGLQGCGPGGYVLTRPPGNSDLKREFENH